MPPAPSKIRAADRLRDVLQLSPADKNMRGALSEFRRVSIEGMADLTNLAQMCLGT